MKFELKTAGNFYPDDNVRESYENLGFSFEKSSYKRFVISDEYPTIEFNELNDLVSFAETYGPLIINTDSITIYDDYIE